MTATCQNNNENNDRKTLVSLESSNLIQNETNKKKTAATVAYLEHITFESSLHVCVNHPPHAFQDNKIDAVGHHSVGQ
jgi:hypothetical protein